MTASSDLSTRFVLAEDAPYLQNMAVLWTVDPALAEMIEDAEGQNVYRVEASRSGSPTVAAATSDGRTIYLHSKYEPAAEAKRLTQSVDAERLLAFYIYGFGFGYHAEALFERAGAEALFVIFEPSVALLRTALESRDFSRMLQSKRLLFFTRLDKGELLTRLTPHSALMSLGVDRVVHPPSEQMAPEFHAQMQLWVEEFESFSRTSINTVVLNSLRTAENIARNIGWYAAAPSLSRLHNRHRNQPAVIVSAGPSLRKNKHLLKDLNERSVLISVQTTLQPLLEMGVEPRFVTSLDYHEVCTRFFERLPATLRTEMVAEPKANSGILSMFPGPISLLGNPFAEGLLRELKLKKPELRGGATVAHLAFYLAEHMGCDPIIFVGQDLGFSDGLFYTPGTSYEDVWAPELSRFCTVEMKQWEQIVRERFILRKIPDQGGRPMYTEERMFTYLQQFERDFLGTQTRVIDATEGGAAKRGTTVMTLAEAAERFCAEPIKFAQSCDHPGLNWDRLGTSVQGLRNRREEGMEIERIARSTLPLLEEIRDHLDDQARVNRAIASIDSLRGRMNELHYAYDLVTQFCQPVELRRFEADRKIIASKAAATEKQRLQVVRDIENVHGILAASIDFQKLMDEVIERLSILEQAQNRSAAA
ncbi:MAG TPA: 6-hydroxymethylpterin diphosphokinase MptE-like protein [Tepidisphaeraceae bacterium]|nr:6-hydroxymethylpterin diphosphokinase MptE-like protein [Tepidisphaeraceae bacterium]